MERQQDANTECERQERERERRDTDRKRKTKRRRASLKHNDERKDHIFCSSKQTGTVSQKQYNKLINYFPEFYFPRL